MYFYCILELAWAGPWPRALRGGWVIFSSGCVLRDLNEARVNKELACVAVLTATRLESVSHEPLKGAVGLTS